jgi:hypothetical protein
MIVAGIALLGLKEWGRRLAIWVAGLKLARLLAIAAAFFIVLVPIEVRKAREQYSKVQVVIGASPGGSGAGRSMTASMVTSFLIMETIQVVGFTLVGSIYPALTLWLLTRPAARAACQPALPPDLSQPPSPV